MYLTVPCKLILAISGDNAQPGQAIDGTLPLCLLFLGPAAHHVVPDGPHRHVTGPAPGHPLVPLRRAVPQPPAQLVDRRDGVHLGQVHAAGLGDAPHTGLWGWLHGRALRILFIWLWGRHRLGRCVGLWGRHGKFTWLRGHYRHGGLVGLMARLGDEWWGGLWGRHAGLWWRGWGV